MISKLCKPFVMVAVIAPSVIAMVVLFLKMTFGRKVSLKKQFEEVLKLDKGLREPLKRLYEITGSEDLSILIEQNEANIKYNEEILEQEFSK